VRGLIIGRFQPFHEGHRSLVAAIHARRPEETLILGIGSAQESFTWKNPFTSSERFEMIDRALAGQEVGRVHIVPVADIQRHAQWVDYLVNLLPPFQRVYTNNPLTRSLFERAKCDVESPALVERGRFEGVHVRERLALDLDWKPLVPPSVAAYLLEIEAPRRLKMLQERETRPEPRPEPRRRR
jgi:nicotinamide-nucleotide adenylyltransferase